MSTPNKTIILYPHEYNLRGGDSKGSVKGVTHTGELVNIKLRVTGSVRNADAAPSISSFAKTSLIESRLSCLASPENSPEAPLGILLFIDCEAEKARDPDPEYSNYYISRWAQILRNGHHSLIDNSEGDLPFIGVGRLVIDKQARVIKEARESIEYLGSAKPDEWEEAIARNEAIINDYRSYDYYLHGYMTRSERSFKRESEAEMIAWMDESMGDAAKNSSRGVLVRLEASDGGVIRELVSELFPIYLKTFRRYQHAGELLEYFKYMNPEIEGTGFVSYRLMPIVKFAGKKIFKDSIASVAAFQKLEETYYIDGVAQTFPVAVKIDRLDNKERLLNKIHLLGPSLGNPSLLSKSGYSDLSFQFEAREDNYGGIPSDSMGELKLTSGLGASSSIFFADWYLPRIIRVSDLDISTISDEIKKEAPITCVQISSENLTPPLSAESVDPTDQPAVEPVSNTLEAVELGTVEVVESSPQQPDSSELETKASHDDVPVVHESDISSELTTCGDSDLDLLLQDEVDLDEDDFDEPTIFGSSEISFSNIDSEDGLVSELQRPRANEEGRHDPEDQGVSLEGKDACETEGDENQEELITDSACVTTDDPDLHSLTNQPGMEDSDQAASLGSDDIDAWMDDEALDEALSESPDAYSDATEEGAPTSTAGIKEKPVQEAPVETPVADVPAPRKGGLARFRQARREKSD